MRAHIFVGSALLVMAAGQAAADTMTVTPAQRAHIATLPASERAEVEKALALDHDLHPVHGDVHIPQANLTLHLGDQFFYLPPDQARRVLTEGWGNPPAVAERTLGLVFPKGARWMAARGWGADIHFEPVGYVSEVEHSQADYDKVDKLMRDSEETWNERRKKAGTVSMHYVGWAQPPSYEDASHTAIWARDLQFGSADVDTLNYDIRTLGRRGVLSMNVISTMPNLPAVRIAAGQLRGVAAFDPGWRYADYKAGDKKAGYGIAGLIAGGAGLLLAKKVGLLGVFAVFGKQILVVVGALVAGLLAKMRRLFGFKDKKRAPAVISPREPPAGG